ncbi:putative membrane protein [Beijerinckia sp. 28-YEA-48]|nr:putative membrane protein [Beijerinckia sp. 28-YEA-48]
MNEEAPAKRPRAFRLDADGTPAGARATVEEQPDAYALETEVPETENAVAEYAQARGIIARRFLSWGSVLASAIGGLVTLALGLWFNRLIDDLFTRSLTLGWVGVALLALALLALAVLLGREIAGVLRQRHIAKLHAALTEARAKDDRDAARSLVTDLASLYAKRPETAHARALVLRTAREIVDGRDLIDITERSLIHPLDELVQREIANAAKRVSVVTAISPRALIDVLFVAAQAVRLVRRTAEIYGGRPGLLGFLRIAKSVGSHLAVTGGMAVGDSLVQQLLGHGIAAKLSARLGEGVLNGLLTARVGLSAMAVCRPMPFSVETPPGVSDVAPFLFSGKKD